MPSKIEAQTVDGKSDAACTVYVTVFYYNVNTAIVSAGGTITVLPGNAITTINPPTVNDKVCLIGIDVNGNGGQEVKIPSGQAPDPLCNGSNPNYPDPCYIDASATFTPTRCVFGIW